MVKKPKAARAGKDLPAAGVKQMVFRASIENWRRVNIAKINLNVSMQALIFDALDEYLRRRDMEGLEQQGGRE